MGQFRRSLVARKLTFRMLVNPAFAPCFSDLSGQGSNGRGLDQMKAIVLLEEGCEEFSSIEGIGQLRCPKGNINAAFDEIRQVLQREGVL